MEISMGARYAAPQLAANADLSSDSGCAHPVHHPASPHAYLCVAPPGLVAPTTLAHPRTGMLGCGGVGMQGCSRIAQGGGCCLPRCVAAAFLLVHRGRVRASRTGGASWHLTPQTETFGSGAFENEVLYKN